MTLNDITHGNPTKEQAALIDEQLIQVMMGRWFLENSKQNLNNSEKTKQELLRVLEKSNGSKQNVTKEIIKTQAEYLEIDKDVLAPYMKLISEKSLKIKKSELITIIKKLEAFITSMKFHYNRPRPSVLASYYKMPIHPDTSKSLRSPSYPSAHTLQSLIISSHITNKYPKLKDQIIEVNKKILESREVLGLSYRSDISCSVQIFKTLDNTFGINEFLNNLTYKM